MFNLSDPVFSPSWKPYTKNLISLFASIVIIAFAVWRFSLVMGFNFFYLGFIIFGIIFFSVMPIYHGRKSAREGMYRRHLETLPLDTLSKYSIQSESTKEKEIIQEVIADKQFN